MESISIVLCTYNGARYLDEQLCSLRSQTGVLEIVAVDDHSSDDTMAVLQRHAAEDSRVRVYWNEGRLGVVRNFERAINLARGEWIALSDQDDIWLPAKIERLRAAWDGTSVLMHHATHKFRGEPPRQLPARAGGARKFSGTDVRRLLYRNSIVGHTTLVRADVARSLLPLPDEVPHDWWIGVGAAINGGVQYVDEYLVHYRIHQSNAYHRAGSRMKRMREDHALRLHLLRALQRRFPLAEPAQRFAQEYRGQLESVEPRRFSWRLAAFYWRHAAVFFGDGRGRPSFDRCARKALAASWTARLQPVPSGFEDVTPTEVPARAASLIVGLGLLAALTAVTTMMFLSRGSRVETARLSSINTVVPFDASAVPAAKLPPYLRRAAWAEPSMLESGAAASGRELAGGPSMPATLDDGFANSVEESQVF